MVFSHEHNTFDKRKLLDNPHPQYCKESDKVVDDFVKEVDLKDFYMNQIEERLVSYEPGKPSMKPDVLQQIIEIEERRRKEAENMAQQMQQQNSGNIMIKQPDGNEISLSNEQTVKILQDQQEKINSLMGEMNNLKQQCTMLAQHCDELNNDMQSRDETITRLKNLNTNLITRIKQVVIESSDIEIIKSEEIISDASCNEERIILEINERN